MLENWKNGPFLVSSIKTNPFPKRKELMNTETTRRDAYNSFQPHLYMALELSQSEWKPGFNIGFGQRPRLRTIKARNLVALQDEIKAAKKRFGLPADAPVSSCYEAGRDGLSRRTSGRCGFIATCSLLAWTTW
jgi:hypothetical protein